MGGIDIVPSVEEQEEPECDATITRSKKLGMEEEKAKEARDGSGKAKRIGKEKEERKARGEKESIGTRRRMSQKELREKKAEDQMKYQGGVDIRWIVHHRKRDQAR